MLERQNPGGMISTFFFSLSWLQQQQCCFWLLSGPGSSDFTMGPATRNNQELFRLPSHESGEIWRMRRRNRERGHLISAALAWGTLDQRRSTKWGNWICGMMPSKRAPPISLHLASPQGWQETSECSRSHAGWVASAQ